MGVGRSKFRFPENNEYHFGLTRPLVYAFDPTPGKTETGPYIYSIGQALLD